MLKLRFGLLLRDGTDEPMMCANSELVAEGIVSTKSGASKLLHRLEDEGVIWSPGAMPPIKGKPHGTRLFLPGPKPEGEEPPEGWVAAGWRVTQRLSDRTPRAARELGPIAVEAEDVERGVAVEPAGELPHEPGVLEAVGGGAAGDLDEPAAAVGCADVEAVEASMHSHTAGGYAALSVVDLIDRAVERTRADARRYGRAGQHGAAAAAGYRLARSLRERGATPAEAEEAVLAFQGRLPKSNGYSAREALTSAASAYLDTPKQNTRSPERTDLTNKDGALLEQPPARPTGGTPMDARTPTPTGAEALR